MPRGKSINVYLIDGIANGKIKAQISNWNGIAYKIPRKLLDDCRSFEAFQQSGVYLLFGTNSVYVGQAEVRKTGKGIHQRIVDHETDRYCNCWEEVVIFTTKDNSLGRTDISYLENRFYNKDMQAGRFSVQNGNEPTIGTVTEEKEAELEEFIDQAELILGALGYKVFEPCKTCSPESTIHNVVSSIAADVPTTSCVVNLPDNSLKIGEFVRTAMRNLSRSGKIFSSSDIDNMCTPEWSVEHFSTSKPFMKRYVAGKTTIYDADGKYPRFWSEPFTYGSETVLISKEWYERQREKFISWFELM